MEHAARCEIPLRIMELIFWTASPAKQLRHPSLSDPEGVHSRRTSPVARIAACMMQVAAVAASVHTMRVARCVHPLEGGRRPQGLVSSHVPFVHIGRRAHDMDGVCCRAVNPTALECVTEPPVMWLLVRVPLNQRTQRSSGQRRPGAETD